MSYTSESRLSKDISVAALRDFVEVLGYQKQGIFRYEGHVSEQYFWYDSTDYKSWDGIELSIYQTDEHVVVDTRTRVARSYYDLIHQNKTIRDIRRLFGGHFYTDEGKNRYMHPEASPPDPAASGCHLAFWRFGNNLITPLHYLQTRTFPEIVHRQAHLMREIGADPIAFSNNLLIPHLVSSVETYFKSTFIALLRYSERKDRVFDRARLMPHHVVSISNGEKSVEDAFAELLSFQNIKSIQNNFALLDRRIDISGQLRRPYRGRKTTLYKQFSDLIELRHDIIHYGKRNNKLDDDAAKLLIYDLEKMVTRVYKHLTTLYDWYYEKWWAIGRG